MTISEFAAGEADRLAHYAGYYNGAHLDPCEDAHTYTVPPPLGDVVAQQAQQIAILRQELQSLREDCSELQSRDAVRATQLAKLERELEAEKKELMWVKFHYGHRLDHIEAMLHRQINEQEAAE